ncbi:MAG: hypothetical protein ABI899_12750, partial [Actinomycetota bacterium]
PRFRGSGKWLIRSADERDQVGRAGFLSRPAVPSRTRFNGRRRVCLGGLLGVGEELAVEGVGDPPLEAAQRFEVGQP